MRIKRHTESTGFHYFDFLSDERLSRDGFFSMDVPSEFGIPAPTVDLGYINVFTDQRTPLTLVLWDSPPELTGKGLFFEDMGMVGALLVAPEDLRPCAPGVYVRYEDWTSLFDGGFVLRTVGVLRAGKSGEASCRVRVKMIWRKI